MPNTFKLAGHVFDNSGAASVGATVTTHTAGATTSTGAAATVTTNSSGYWEHLTQTTGVDVKIAVSSNIRWLRTEDRAILSELAIVESDDGQVANLYLAAGRADAAGDSWRTQVKDSGTAVTYAIGNDKNTQGTYVDLLTITGHDTATSSLVTAAGALTVAGLITANGGITFAAGDDIAFTGSTGTNDITLTDSLADALSITRGGTDMVVFNSSTPSITFTPATTFTGAITADGGVVGALTGTASSATEVVASANNSTDETVYPTFVDGTTGSQGIETDSGFTYNPSSGLLTISGELDAGSLDISGNADIDGTLEADAITVDGATLAEYIADTAGAMFTSNTETGITATYQDADNTIDLVVGTLNQDTTGTAAVATTVTITDNENTNENNAVIFTSGGDVDGGNIGLESDGDFTYNPSTGTVTATTFVGALTGNVTGNVSGSAATVTGSTQSNITAVGTLGSIDIDGGAIDGVTLGTNSAVTQAVIDNININGTTIGHTSDTDLLTLTSANLAVAGDIEVSGSVEVATIDYTDGDLSMTIADGGGVTFAQDVTLTADKSLNLPHASHIAFTDAIGDNTIDDHDAQGIIMTFKAGSTVTPFSPGYLHTDNEVHEADADEIAKMPCIGVSINTANVSDGADIEVMVLGLIRDDDFNFGTAGAPVYVAAGDPGLMTNTAPSGTDDVVQIVGHSIGDDALFVQPCLTTIEHA